MRLVFFGLTDKPIISSRINCYVKNVDADDKGVIIYWSARANPEININQEEKNIIDSFHGSVSVRIGEEFTIPRIGSFSVLGIYRPDQSGSPWVALAPK